MSYFIVWNKSRSEAYVTDDRIDATHAAHGSPDGCGASLALAFFEAYGDENLTVETVVL